MAKVKQSRSSPRPSRLRSKIIKEAVSSSSSSSDSDSDFVLPTADIDSKIERLKRCEKEAKEALKKHMSERESIRRKSMKASLRKTKKTPSNQAPDLILVGSSSIPPKVAPKKGKNKINALPKIPKIQKTPKPQNNNQATMHPPPTKPLNEAEGGKGASINNFNDLVDNFLSETPRDVNILETIDMFDLSLMPNLRATNEGDQISTQADQPQPQPQNELENAIASISLQEEAQTSNQPTQAQIAPTVAQHHPPPQLPAQAPLPQNGGEWGAGYVDEISILDPRVQRAIKRHNTLQKNFTFCYRWNFKECYIRTDLYHSHRHPQYPKFLMHCCAPCLEATGLVNTEHRGVDCPRNWY